MNYGLLVSTVSDQTLAPVVSTSIITEGGWFSLYCDSTRVATPSRNPIGILSLALYRNVTDGKNTLIAQYTSVTPPGVDPEIKVCAFCFVIFCSGL